MVKVRIGTAILVKPDSLPVQWTKAVEVLFEASELAYDDIATSADIAAARALPQVSMRVTFEDGTAREVRTTGALRDFYIVKYPRGGWVKVSKLRLDIFRRPVPELASKPVPGAAPDDGWAPKPPPGFGVLKAH
jgi:hypothetical protein